MGNKVTDEQVAVVRSVVGQEFSEMDIIRALHLANNDAGAAINIIFDTPLPRLTGMKDADADAALAPRGSTPAPRKFNIDSLRSSEPDACIPDRDFLGSSEPAVKPSSSVPKDSDWWLVGSSELAGLSTCKGRRLKPGDMVTLLFPSERSSSCPPSAGRGRSVAAAACSEIVRFSTAESGEIGRIPNEWARCLSPLVRAKKIRIEGCCKSAPDILGIMDTILLSISVYINSSMFRKQHQTLVRSTRFASEESTVHPLPTLFRLLGLIPFKKVIPLPSNKHVPGYSVQFLGGLISG